MSFVTAFILLYEMLQSTETHDHESARYCGDLFLNTEEYPLGDSELAPD